MIALETFARSVVASRLVEPVRVQRCLARLGDGKVPAQSLADLLVVEGLLTPWQARQIAAGKGRYLKLEGRYHLLDKLGEGGMGAVFRALDARLGRQVVLKIPRLDRLKNPVTLKRFRREALANGRLEHPNIVRALDVGCDGAVHFIVFEMVEGLDLRKILSENGPIPPTLAVHYVAQAAAALDFAHRQGVIHRDIKPANLIITADDVLKVLDLGFARLYPTAEPSNKPAGSSQEPLTQLGLVVGTPAYIAPEQAQDTRLADIRSDIYSLGCTLFECLSGRPPFHGTSTFETLMKHVRDPAPRIVGIDPELEAILIKMLAKDQAERQQTPSELLAELKLWQANGTSPARRLLADPLEQLEQARLPAARWAAADDEARRLSDQSTMEFDKNNPRPAPSSVHLMVPPEAVYAERDIPEWLASTSGEGKASKAPAGGRKPINTKMWIAAGMAILFSLSMSAFGWFWMGQTEVEIDWPEPWRTGGSLEIDGQNVSLPTLGDLDFPGSWGRRTVRLARPGYEPIDVQLSLGRGERRTIVPDWRPTAKTERKQQLQELAEEVSQTAAQDPVDLEVLDLRSRLRDFQRHWAGTLESVQSASLLGRLPSPMDLLSDHNLPPLDPPNVNNLPVVGVFGRPGRPWKSKISIAQHPEARYIALAGPEIGLQWWNITTGEKRPLLPPHSNTTSVAFDATGDLFASAGSDGVLRFFDAVLGKEIEMGDPNYSGRTPAFSADQSRLALVHDKSISIWSMTEGLLLRSIAPKTAPIRSLAFSPNDQWLASVARKDDNTAAEVALWNVDDGSTLWTIDQSVVVPRSACFSPRGLTLAVGGNDGAISLWETTTGNRRRVLKGHAAPVLGVAYSPDGETLASSAADGSVRIWDPKNAVLLHTYAVGPKDGSVDQVLFSSDGRHIVTANGNGTVYILRLPALSKRRQQVFKPAADFVR